MERGEDGALIGRGVSFVLVDILQKRFNFTYEVVVPEKNFEIGGTKPEDSLIGLVNNSVSSFEGYRHSNTYLSFFNSRKNVMVNKYNAWFRPHTHTTTLKQR